MGKLIGPKTFIVGRRYVQRIEDGAIFAHNWHLDPGKNKNFREYLPFEEIKEATPESLQTQIEKLKAQQDILLKGASKNEAKSEEPAEDEYYKPEEPEKKEAGSLVSTFEDVDETAVAQAFIHEFNYLPGKKLPEYIEENKERLSIASEEVKAKAADKWERSKLGQLPECLG